MDRAVFEVELGLLGFLKYRVGADGLLRSERKTILDKTLILPTKFFKAQVKNWEEWGDPNSPTRCMKMMATLSSLLANATGRPGMKKAVKDWQHDLDYVREKLSKDKTAHATLA
jgi:hypothetical protein